MALTYSEQDDLARKAIRGIDRVSDKGWGRATCPFCLRRAGKPDRRKSFGFNIETGEWHCFKCHARGRLVLSDSAEAREYLSKPRGRGVSPDFGPPEGYTPLWEGDGLNGLVFAEARQYLESRGVNTQIIEQARIGACLHGPQQGRTVVPALESDGEWYGWTARFWGSSGGSGPKYFTAPGMDTYRRLYNESALDVDTVEPLILVEGVYDALPLWPEAVAFYGKPSDGQFARLCQARRPLVVALDGDAWIESEMLALRLQLEGISAGWLRLPPTRDPGDLGPEIISAAARRTIDQ